MAKGICILVEAPDGAGKDTLITNIQKHYPNQHFKIYKFPSGKIREKIMAQPRTQLELVPMFCQDFQQTIASIKKDLAAGKNIIINRMYISTLIYSKENGVPSSTVLYYIDKAIGKWRPDLTVLIDVDPSEAFRRLASRDDEKNWLDGTFEKQLNINTLYKNFFKKDWNKLYQTKNNIIQVNANGTKDQTLIDFGQKYQTWLKTRQNEQNH